MKTVILKKYANATEAYIDAEKLRSEGVDCQVMEDNSFSFLAFANAYIVVLEDVKEEAERILGEE